MRGRELLRLIIKYYQTNRTADAVYNLTDLQKVRIVRGNIEGFQSTWTMVLSGMRKQPDEDILELLYYERVESFQGIAEDIAHYNRLHEGSGGDRSYFFLFNAVQRHLQRTRQRTVREAISLSLGDAGKPAAPGAKGDQEGGGKGKIKGDSSAVCRYFAAGNCTKGAECKFKHVIGNSQGNKGEGKKGRNKDQRSNYKRPGSATRGGDGRPSDNGGRAPSDTGRRDVCRMFQQGQCKWGAKCKFKHSKLAAPASGTDESGADSTPACAVRFSDNIEVVEFARGSPAKAASAKYVLKDYDDPTEDRMWLLDTGCPVDLVQTNTLTDEQLARREKAECPIALDTANDRVEADQCVLMQVDGIFEQIDPLCLAATPSVLSLGKRCRANGFGFYWHPYDCLLYTSPSPRD